MSPIYKPHVWYLNAWVFTFSLLPLVFEGLLQWQVLSIQFLSLHFDQFRFLLCCVPWLAMVWQWWFAALGYDWYRLVIQMYWVFSLGGLNVFLFFLNLLTLKSKLEANDPLHEHWLMERAEIMPIYGLVLFIMAQLILLIRFLVALAQGKTVRKVDYDDLLDQE
jgi:hypothetical protein